MRAQMTAARCRPCHCACNMREARACAPWLSSERNAGRRHWLCLRKARQCFQLAVASQTEVQNRHIPDISDGILIVGAGLAGEALCACLPQTLMHCAGCTQAGVSMHSALSIRTS